MLDFKHTPCVIVIFLVLITTLLLGMNTVSSARSVDDFEQWSMVTLDAHLKPKIRLYLEVQPRIGDHLSNMDRLLLRGALGYQLTKHASVWQGYAWTPSFENINTQENNFTDKYRPESRIYQQLLLEHEWRKLKITNRTRLEERFVANSGGTAVRARHMLKLSYPITKSGKWSVVGYDELFVNANDTPNGPKSGFDQNRLFLGLNRKLSPYASIEFGYMNNPGNVFNNTTNRVNHILMVVLNFKI